ncbi:MAG: deoxyribonuclease IV [bacterium]|nr:deoxyribonuclease IV [bacterium]
MKPKIGAHVSVAGGLEKGIENALAIGAECIQIFGASPRQWAAKIPSQEEIARYRAAVQRSGIGPVFLHAAYLVNLASPDKGIYEKSVKNLAQHLRIAEAISAEGLIFHVGAGKELPREKATSQVAKGVQEVLRQAPGKVQLIMENSATPKKLGDSPEEIGEIMAQVRSPRVKMCLDTAHACGAGLLASFSKQEILKFVRGLDKSVGLENLVAIHANDSKAPSGSARDLHENIGKGYIGKAGFRHLLAESKLRGKPWILEVPGFSGEGPDKKNVEMLKSLR